MPSAILRENVVPRREMPTITTTQKYRIGQKCVKPAEKAKRELENAGLNARAKHWWARRVSLSR